MRILIIDGQGGGLGKALTEQCIKRFADCELTCVGTNSAATAAMLRAGAKRAATGENAVVVACRTADVILGPLGIVIADSLLGEITPKMALAVGQSEAERILLPVSHCRSQVAGVGMSGLTELVADAMSRLEQLIK